MRQLAGFIEFRPFQETMDQSKTESLEKVNHKVTLMCSQTFLKTFVRKSAFRSVMGVVGVSCA